MFLLKPIKEVVEPDEWVLIPLALDTQIREGAPMWKPEHRLAADRSGLRCPSDLTGMGDRRAHDPAR